MIEVLTSGLMNSVQDLGRPGYLDQGIGRAGAMDREAMRIANLLVGNVQGAAGIEIAMFPFRLKFIEPATFAVTGAHCPAMVNGSALTPWSAACAQAGDELRLDPPVSGARVYLAFGGGVDVPDVLGSKSTDLKSVFGGLEGRALKRGDRLVLGGATVSLFSPAGRRRPEGSDEGVLFAAEPSANPSSPRIRSALLPAGGKREQVARPGKSADPYYFRDSLGGTADGEPLTLRVMAGAEFPAFNVAARLALFSDVYHVSGDNNRQGMRIEGRALALTSTLELMSHGIMPGTVQVPQSGAPVIQLAEANTCGGYPKIAHVIEPDLWKLAQAPSGAGLRFELISRDAALAAIRDSSLHMRRFENLLATAAARRAG